MLLYCIYNKKRSVMYSEANKNKISRAGVSCVQSRHNSAFCYPRTAFLFKGGFMDKREIINLLLSLTLFSQTFDMKSDEYKLLRDAKNLIIDLFCDKKE